METLIMYEIVLVPLNRSLGCVWSKSAAKDLVRWYIGLHPNTKEEDYVIYEITGQRSNTVSLEE